MSDLQTPKATTSVPSRCSLSGDFIIPHSDKQRARILHLERAERSAYRRGSEDAYRTQSQPQFKQVLEVAAERLQRERVQELRRQILEAWPLAGPGEVEHRVRLALQRDNRHPTPIITSGTVHECTFTRVRFTLPALSFEVTSEDYS